MKIAEVFPDIEIPSEEIVFFNNHIFSVLIAEGDYFITSDTICNKIGFVNSGLLESTITNGTEKHVIAHYVKNQFVSVFNSFFNQENSIWTIQALEPTHLTVISAQLFHQLCQRHVCWTQFWLRVFETNTFDLIEQERHLLRE